MLAVALPADCRYDFDLTDPAGGPPRRATVIVTTPSDWPRWPEAAALHRAARTAVPPRVLASPAEGPPATEDRP